MKEFLKETKKEIQEQLLLAKLEFKQMMKTRHFWQVQLLNILKIMMTLGFWISGLFAFRSFVALFFVQKAWPSLHNVEGREQVLSGISSIIFLIIAFLITYYAYKGMEESDFRYGWRFVKRAFIIWSFWLILMGLRNESVEGTVRDISQSFQIITITFLLGFSFLVAHQITRFVVFRKIDQQDIFEKWIPMFRWYEVEERTRQDVYNALGEEKEFQTGFKSSKFKTIRFKLKYSKIEMKRTTYQETRTVYGSKEAIPPKEPEPLDFSDYPFILDGDLEENEILLGRNHMEEISKNEGENG